MNIIWWWHIRQRLGLPRISWHEMRDELQEMSIDDLYEYIFKAMYGHIEEDKIHPYDDEQFWVKDFWLKGM